MIDFIRRKLHKRRTIAKLYSRLFDVEIDTALSEALIKEINGIEENVEREKAELERDAANIRLETTYAARMELKEVEKKIVAVEKRVEGARKARVKIEEGIAAGATGMDELRARIEFVRRYV